MPEKDVFIEVLVSREKQSRESSEELIAFARGLLPGDFIPDDDFSPRIDSNIKAFIEKTPDLDTVKYNAAVL
ncbi:MAG: hypothetical protein GY859_38885, partial [Desulfobacterales bacterium]|nr:hypothetical protein [Desulfobacterales bacterium]